MKKKLALIHTVKWYERSVIEPFGRDFAEQNPQVEIINIMDDSLYAMAAEAAGADAIMCSCTTMGEATRTARSLVSVPMFNIDEPMAREAVAAGGKIGIVATVPTSAPATRTLLLAEAGRVGREIRMETAINEQAFRHLLAGEIEKHDMLVRQEIDRLASSVDVIALGQISLSKLQHQARVPILQVGRSGFAEARRVLLAA
jgi:aspartate/glutamate racemase